MGRVILPCQDIYWTLPRCQAQHQMRDMYSSILTWPQPRKQTLTLLFPFYRWEN